MRGPVETLLFDFGGTLDADGVAWKDRFYAYYRAEGLDMTAEAFAPVFYAADDPLTGLLPVDADLSDTAHRLAANLEDQLARRPGGAQSDARRGQRIAAHFLRDASAALTRNRALLDALAQRYRLGVVANFYGNLDAVCRGAGLASLFSAIIDSTRVGTEKPGEAIFRAALEPLQATPDRTLFIGDSLRRDREGARRMQMGFIWIAPAEAQAAELRAAGVQPDHPTIERLGALAEMLL
jgi:FMN hydrolase / 5-amino-6-(5-phospho-D-ribitylamino)uracil phosphatase